jgi:hypothetical protein
VPRLNLYLTKESLIRALCDVVVKFALFFSCHGLGSERYTYSKLHLKQRTLRYLVTEKSM